MTSRSSSAILSLASLTAGVVLGVAADRGGPIVSAQVAPSVRPEAAAPDSDRTPNPENGAQRSREDQRYARLAKQYEQFAFIDRTFALVAEAVSPSVVHIVAQKVSRRDSLETTRTEETGSGVIVRCDRATGLYVLTNHHVVNGAVPAKIQIRLSDGRTVTPEKIWSDWEADVAVLKLGQSDLPAGRLGNSDEAVVGTWVLALGSPFGLMQSVSQGIISARGRHMEELQEIHNQDFLQTDAAINPGNSGGPLVNMKGEVIGINNSIASEGGGNEGVGFSIPINLARWIMNELVVRGRVNRGALGVDLHAAYRQKDAAALGLDRPRGAWVEVVHPLTPAANGGLHDGDVILRFGGVEITDLNHLINTVSMAPIGEAADLAVWRDRREIHLKVTVGERERAMSQPTHRNEGPAESSEFIRRPERPAAPSSFALGLELKTLSPKLSRDLALPNSLKGAIVVTVDPDGSLSKICRPNDVVSAVDGREIISAEQAVRLLNARTDPEALIIVIDRPNPNGEIQRFSVQIP